MKYEFIKIDDDTTKLKYKDKEFEIKRDIELQSKAQDSIRKSKVQMSKDLASMGMTRQDLVIEKHDGNKTIYDNTNAIELEKEYEKQASLVLFNELCQRFFKMNMDSLMVDIGLDFDNTIECEKFGIELSASFMGETLKSPSEKEQDII